jgi:apolipoprotein N-acyltransferase
MKFLTKNSVGNSLAFFAGAMLTLAFAPFSYYPLAVISPAILLMSWLSVTSKQALLRGWLYGLGLFGTSVYWIFISVHTYGYASIPIATIITAAFIALLAIFPALNGYLLNRFFPHTNSAKILCAFPVIWIALEWVRSWIFTGFPWVLLGYSQIDSPLRGYAPIFSVYGVSLAVLVSSGLLVDVFIKPNKKYICILAILIIWLLGYSLNSIVWTTPFKKPVQITLVQGNIPQNLKWTYEEILPTLDLYRNLSKNHWNSKIVIWPEAAIPLPLQDALDYIQEMNTTAKNHHSALITGIPLKDDIKDAYYNSVIALGNSKGLYLKHRLVPFGEYIPFPIIFDPIFKNILNIPFPDSISAKTSDEYLLANGFKIAPFICYEIAFPQQVRFDDSTINMILTVSNDAWFGRSIAQAQHLEMGQMRALEMGRPVLFVSNNGITAIIDSQGKIQSRVPQFEQTTLTDQVQATIGKTPWQQFSLAPILIIMLLLLGIAIRKR